MSYQLWGEVLKENEFTPMSKKEDNTAEKVCSYLKEQNRPYSLNDIFLNLHKEFGKTAVQKALDSLVEAGSVKEKNYGKQKVYVISQHLFPPVDEKKLQEMDQQIAELTRDLEKKTKELNEVESKLKDLGTSLTTEEIHHQLAQVSKEIEEMEESLAKVQSSSHLVSKQVKERAECERERNLKEWKKRKRIAQNILDAILEGYPKSKRELFEEIDIETDQEAGVDLSNFV